MTAPGIYPDMPEAQYRADPALSCSEARRVLELPAKYRHDRATGERHADHFDFGKAAHRLVLGDGPDIAVIEADDWRTKDAREAKAEAHLNGQVPLLAKDYEVVLAMARVVRDHPIAGVLLNPEHGQGEVSMFWEDPRTRAPLRARLDWLPGADDARRPILPDYKSAPAADARSFGKSAASFGYHAQHAWYCDGYAALTGTDPAFVFIVQEREAPYFVHVVELTPESVAVGRDRNRRAIDVWLECQATGVWPGYPNEVTSVSLPRWAFMQHDEDVESWPDPNPDHF